MKWILFSLFVISTACTSESDCCAICATNASSSPAHTWGTTEIMIVVVSAAIVLLTLLLNIKYIFSPKEAKFQNIKRIVVDETF